MPTTKQKKLREQRETAKRRRLHGQKAQVTTNSPGIENPDCAGCPHPASAHRGSLCDECGAPPPARAKCPQCGFSHKVRKDGAMSRHDVYHGSEPTQCTGTGQPWNAAASPA